MAVEATTILQLILSLAWTCLFTTPTNQKNPLLTQVFTSQLILEQIASTTSLVFAPGLFEAIQAAAPPTIEYFKTLPTDTTKRWAVYLLVLEKATCRPKIYVGSGTESQYGVSVRLSQYDRKNSLPRYVQQAIDDGYIIVHKGLLCWTAIPPPSLVPKIRLLFFLLEATFAYAFWAMRTTKNDYNMTHICPWAVNVIDMAPEFGYDGLCSHCSLGEGVSGDFGLSEEQLEALADQKEARAAAKSVYGSSVHFEQMANNQDEYLEKQAGYKVLRRAQDGGEYHRQNARDNAAKHHKAKTHFCETFLEQTQENKTSSQQGGGDEEKTYLPCLQLWFQPSRHIQYAHEGSSPPEEGGCCCGCPVELPARLGANLDSPFGLFWTSGLEFSCHRHLDLWTRFFALSIPLLSLIYSLDYGLGIGRRKSSNSRSSISYFECLKSTFETLP